MTESNGKISIRTEAFPTLTPAYRQACYDYLATLFGNAMRVGHGDKEAIGRVQQQAEQMAWEATERRPRES